MVKPPPIPHWSDHRPFTIGQTTTPSPLVRPHPFPIGQTTTPSPLVRPPPLFPTLVAGWQQYLPVPLPRILLSGFYLNFDVTIYNGGGGANTVRVRKLLHSSATQAWWCFLQFSRPSIVLFLWQVASCLWFMSSEADCTKAPQVFYIKIVEEEVETTAPTYNTIITTS